MKLRLVYLLGVLFCVGCQAAGPSSSSNVLVIVNDNSADSKEVGSYYAAKRKIPEMNIVHVKCPTVEFFSSQLEYYNKLEKPIEEHIKKNKLTIDYIVLTRGIPIKPSETYTMSIDSILAAMDLDIPLTELDHTDNPYFLKDEPFSHKKFGIYLVTRLDGYTLADAKALVDRSLAAKPAKGIFLIDTTPYRSEGGYGAMSRLMDEAHRMLLAKEYVCFYDDKAEFIGDLKNLMGYFSWGSNDNAYTLEKYKSNEFRPGAIVETAVSTSARSLRPLNDGGQSLICDLVSTGVTGAKGYVSEPTLAAIADPRILFTSYISGRNLAESFYAASRWVCWKDIVLGDPLCAPYK